MNITVSRDSFLSALATVRGFVDRSTTIPIMSCVRLVAEQDKLQVLATDMIMTGQATIDATIENPGAVVIHAETLYALISRIPAESLIKLTLDRASMLIESGRIKASIETPIPASMFPSTHEGCWPIEFKLDRDDLIRIFSLPSPAHANDLLRPFMTGIHVSKIDGRLAGTATNGKILIRSFAKMPDTLTSFDRPVTIPAKAIASLKSVTADNILVGLSDRSAQFHAGNVVITTKLIVYDYPDASGVILDKVDSTIEINRVDLIKAVDLIMTMTDKDTKGISLECAPGSVRVSSVLLATKGAYQDMTATLSGAPFRIGVNGKHLMTLLGVCSGETVKIGHGLNRSQYSMIRVFDPNNDDLTMIIVPERI